ncbi:hypothetical protein BDP55DRAFT_756193 [Colletotrichum godetiae]|uniref:Uncharacterized protein n=1 Tax=Colletotrichum godetiae TaxID=1209918 RepID=A0AAJ0F2F6_9PEZI|nr:uncharacterized protein BDP55DRAFT_756193 [Colletotrichum godetiae]KAK1690448.1 hypothetical protein BDP55DRAFT_756193 [Colletotrichum godetiae]
MDNSGSDSHGTSLKLDVIDFQSTYTPVNLEETEENLRDDTYQGSESSIVENDGGSTPSHLVGSATVDDGDFQDPENDSGDNEAVYVHTGVPDNPKNPSWRLGDANTRPSIAASSRNPTSGEILRANDTSGPFCRHCKDNSKRSSQKYRAGISPLYCSGCRRGHPSSLFSAKQRQKESNKRICIGREGHIRLCEHKTFGWDELCIFLRQPMRIRASHAHLRSSNSPAVIGTHNEVKAIFGRENHYASWASVIGLDKRAHVKISAFKLREQPGWNPFANECPREISHTSKTEKWLRVLISEGSLPQSVSLVRRLSRCTEHDGCIILPHRRKIELRSSNARVLEHYDSQWYQALDPASHNLVEDIEFKAVTWCEEARCRNFHGFRDHASVGISTK